MAQLPLSLHEPPATVALAPGATLLRGFALEAAPRLLADVERVASAFPFRHMETPGGFRMSAALTSCGDLGWVSDRGGYRYAPVDPASGARWPPIPASFLALAAGAAAAAGYPGFAPDACLINRYQPGARMALHQDRQERDTGAPIVSVSLGLPAIFLFGGDARSDTPRRFRLLHGDVAVWGGPSRLFFHGIQPIERAAHPLVGSHRINLTFRNAG